MLETGNGLQAAHANGREGTLTLDESITEFSMWAISASPLVVTTPIYTCGAPKDDESIDTEGPMGERRSTVDRECPECKLEAQPDLAEVDESVPCVVNLTKQHSEAECQLGKTYGCYGTAANKTMWTKGCRGVFVCDGVTDVVCDIDGSGTHICPCKKGNPVGPPPPGPPNPPKHNCKGSLNEIQKIVLLNKKVIAINQDVTPQGRVIVEGDSTVWARKLSDGSVAVAFYNDKDKPASIGTSLHALGIQAKSATVDDLWGNHSAASPPVPPKSAPGGVITNVTVRAHSTVVLRIYPSK
eukprot:SAG31_NODE_5118_length_2730_cov_6.394147_3_plen_298_part_00